MPPYLALAFGVLAVSFASIFIRLAEAPPLAIAFWRCAIASVVLLAVSRGRWRVELAATTAHERRLAVLAGFFLAVHFASWIQSLEYTTVASSVLLVNTTPIWVGLLTPLLTHDRIGRGVAGGIVLSSLGGVLVAGGDLELGGRALLGDALALTGGLTLSLYFLAGRRLRAKLSLPCYAGLCYGAAAVFLLLFSLAARTPLSGFSASSWGWILACALVPQLLGHTTNNWVLRWIPAALVSVAQLGDTVCSTLLAVLVLHELPPAAIYWGGPMILAGIAWAVLSERRPAERGLRG